VGKTEVKDLHTVGKTEVKDLHTVGYSWDVAKPPPVGYSWDVAKPPPVGKTVQEDLPPWVKQCWRTSHRGLFLGCYPPWVIPGMLTTVGYCCLGRGLR